MLTAVGLDPILVGPTTLRDVLTSDLTDPESQANTLGVAYRTIAGASTSRRTVRWNLEKLAQTPAQEATVTDFYMMNYGMKAITAEETQTNYYKMKIATALSVDDILNDSKLFTYVREGLWARSRRRDEVQNPASHPERRERSHELRAAASRRSLHCARQRVQLRVGTVKRWASMRAQIDSARSATITRYTITLGTLETDQARGKVESEYYASTIDEHWIGGCAARRDKRLVTYIKRAFGFEGETIYERGAEAGAHERPLRSQKLREQAGELSLP